MAVGERLGMSPPGFPSRLDGSSAIVNRPKRRVIMTTADSAPRRKRLRPLAVLAGFALLAGTGIAAWVWSLYSGSLPVLDGSLTVGGISAPVRIERDARGIPTIHA